MPLAKCSFGMIPLSRHSVDRSPWAFHSSTHNVVRASCFEVKAVSGWKPLLGRELAMELVSLPIFLKAAICVETSLMFIEAMGIHAIALLGNVMCHSEMTG